MREMKRERLWISVFGYLFNKGRRKEEKEKKEGLKVREGGVGEGGSDTLVGVCAGVHVVAVVERCVQRSCLLLCVLLVCVCRACCACCAHGARGAWCVWCGV